MPIVDITRLDPSDDEAHGRWHDVYLRADHEGRPFAVPWQRAEEQPELQEPGTRRLLLGFAGTLSGAVVCVGKLSMPLLDNLRAADLDVYTDPAHRGSGHGSQMLGHLEAVAAEHGRTLFNAMTHYPLASPADGSGHVHADFLTHRGWTFAIGDLHRVLELPTPAGLLERLGEHTTPHHQDYRVETFVGRVPEEYVESFAALDAALMTEAPMGEGEREMQSADVGAFRELEDNLERQGRTMFHAVGVDGSGVVVAYTTIAVSRYAAGSAFQFGTLVDRAHRGHRLGVAVKVANLLRLERADPAVRTLTTYNAEVNAHMVAVNDAMGFRPVERLGEFQKRL